MIQAAKEHQIITGITVNKHPWLVVVVVVVVGFVFLVCILSIPMIFLRINGHLDVLVILVI